MALRDWPGRRILLIWAVAAAVQLAFLSRAIVDSWRLRSEGQVVSTADTASTRLTLDSAGRADILQLLADSLGVLVEMRGDTIAGVQLTARGDSILSPVGEAIGAALANALPSWPEVILVVTLVFLPTLLALGLTLAWVVARRRVLAA